MATHRNGNRIPKETQQNEQMGTNPGQRKIRPTAHGEFNRRDLNTILKVSRDYIKRRKQI